MNYVKQILIVAIGSVAGTVLAQRLQAAGLI